ncbi:cation diffusion facilitator family transporter [Rhodococcus sp. ACT016]|uniref:cation diffusion facilitator family transporter n=1 Tax=Rhodococcus sp. ACT016 TaxID=3134808 RepID=UPI003D2D3985
MATSPTTRAESGGESTLTVVVAFAANALIALAKSVAAVLTGSASMVAEATHSWADTGNEILLLVADRRARKSPDRAHPLGFGREAYIWSLFAALGLFAVGAGVSVTHGIQELAHPQPASDFGVAYVVLAIAFVLEAISFRQAFKQLRGEASAAHRDVLEHALLTSDPTVRAVFAEDAAALIGLVIAFAGVLAHQLTGSPVPDAIGSIAVGILLGVIALVLLDRNRRFLVGEPGTPELQSQTIAKLLSYDEIERVTYLRMEFLGPHQVYLVASVDLVGDYAESRTAHTLRALEDRITGETAAVRKTVLTLSTADEPSLTN